MVLLQDWTMKRLFLWFLLGLVNMPLIAAKKDVATAADKTPSMNEMTGTVQSVDLEAKTIRLQTENGYSVEFTFDRETVCKGIGVPHTVSDLAFKDEVIIRYAGRDLIAREIEKRNLQPAVAASTPTSPAN